MTWSLAVLLWLYLIVAIVLAMFRLGEGLDQHDHDNEHAAAGVIVRLVAPCAR